METYKYSKDPDGALVTARVIREVGQIPVKLGIPLEEQWLLPVKTLCSEPLADAVNRIRQFGVGLETRAPNAKPSTLMDLQNGRRLEVEETLGYAVLKGEELGVPMEGKLFISVGEDLGGAGIYVLSPGANGVFDGIPPTGDDEVTKFDTLSLGLRDPEGIGFHPERGTLFIVSRIENMLVETTPSGTALNTYDISFTEIRKPSGVGIGPGSQDPEKYSIYITDRGVDNNDDPNENDGKIYEFLLMEQVYVPLIFR